jgi:hypothetical protein
MQSFRVDLANHITKIELTIGDVLDFFSADPA